MKLTIRKDKMKGNEGGYNVRFFESNSKTPYFSSHIRFWMVPKAVLRGLFWMLYQKGVLPKPYLH